MVLPTPPNSDRFSTASAISRPLFSDRAPRATRVHTHQRVAMPRPQTRETGTATASSLQQQHQRRKGSPISTRPKEGVVNRGDSALPKPSKLAISTATTPSRPAPAHMPRERARGAGAAPGPFAPNFSRPQVSPAAAAAAAAACPHPTRHLTPVREVGFENWAIRHESVAALPWRGREYAAVAGIVRPYSTVYEEDAASEQLSGLPSPTSAPSASERTVGWQRNSARNQPAALLRAPDVRSYAASLVATTATATESVSSTMAVRSLGTGVLRPSLPEHGALAAATMENARTYLDMQAVAERSPTLLPPVSVGSLAHLGENFSSWSSGTLVNDIHRRGALARKFDAPGNAHLAGERRFAATFVDAPGRIRVGTVESAKSLRGSRGGVESAAPIVSGGGQGEKKTREKKQGKLWRSLASVLRKLRRKGKKTASPSSSCSSSSSPSSSVPTPSSLVQGFSSNEVSSPATPTQVHAEPLRVPPKRAVPAATPKRSDAGTISQLTPSEQARPLRTFAAEPVSPLSGASPADKHSAAGTTALTPPRRREYGTLTRPRNRSSPASNEVNKVVSATSTSSSSSDPRANEIDDLLFYQPWGSAGETEPAEPQAELFEALKQEADVAGWGSDSREQVAQVQPMQVVGKGKARLVETQPARSRYRAKRRDTLAELEDGATGGARGSDSWPLANDGMNGHGYGPIVAISGLRSYEAEVGL